MSRVITFSRFFPSYHPRKGEPTFFEEKVLSGLGLDHLLTESCFQKPPPKYHTIRAGNRWKVGDKFSPRVWSGKPYNSKQRIISPDIEVKKVWDFEMDLNGVYSINSKCILTEDEDFIEEQLAKNDGLNITDFFHWFMPNYNKPKEFKGQIICWNDKIEY